MDRALALSCHGRRNRDIIKNMKYEFSIGWCIFGIILTALGLLLVRFYKQVADNFGWGANSYNKYQMIGVGMCVVGIIMIFNLHTLILDLIGTTFFGAIINGGK